MVLAVTQIGLFNLSGVSGAALIETELEKYDLTISGAILLCPCGPNLNQILVLKTERDK